MNYYLAPLEGITGYTFRNAYHDLFPTFDKYFSPFLVPNMHHCFKNKELRDIAPENNQSQYTVPQLLTNNADDFIWAAGELAQLGYDEINLNLGCPARTVVSKGKGSGFLARPAELDAFLYQIFARTNIKISLKTRIGKDNPDEFTALMEIFNKYPLKELIIHPRLQTDYYKNKPNYEAFRYAVGNSKNPIVYNGDIFSQNDFINFTEKFPTVQTIMLGRGILRNPGLIHECKGNPPVSKNQLRAFHDRIYSDYQALLSGEKNVLFKMKELWIYLIMHFADSEKYFKKIKKVERQSQYEIIIDHLFAELDIV